MSQAPSAVSSREHRLDEVVGVERLAGAGGEVGRRVALREDPDQLALGGGQLRLDAIDALVVGLGAGVAGREAVQVQQHVDGRRAGGRGGQDHDRPAREVAARDALDREPAQAGDLALARVRGAGPSPADLAGEHRRDGLVACGARIGALGGRRLGGGGRSVRPGRWCTWRAICRLYARREAGATGSRSTRRTSIRRLISAPARAQTARSLIGFDRLTAAVAGRDFTVALRPLRSASLIQRRFRQSQTASEWRQPVDDLARYSIETRPAGTRSKTAVSPAWPVPLTTTASPSRDSRSDGRPDRTRPDDADIERSFTALESGGSAGGAGVGVGVAVGVGVDDTGGPSAIDVSGGVVSTLNVIGPELPVLPAPSLCDATAVYVPSASAGLTSTFQDAPERVATACGRRAGGARAGPHPHGHRRVVRRCAPGATVLAARVPDRFGVVSFVSGPRAPRSARAPWGRP